MSPILDFHILFIYIIHTMANNPLRVYSCWQKRVTACGEAVSFNRSSREKKPEPRIGLLSSSLLYLSCRGGGSHQQLLHRSRSHGK